MDADDPLQRLWPRPQLAHRVAGRFRLPAAPRVSVAAPRHRLSVSLEALFDRLQAAGHAAHLDDADNGGSLHLRLEDSGTAEGYRLRISEGGVDLAGADEAGLARGLTTLGQWIDLLGPQAPGGLELPRLVIDDRPSFRHRGALLDVSRNRVPTMTSLQALVDLLAGWKVNQLQLYTEHTFAYRGHEVVWRNASPLTAQEVRQLDAYCRDRFVELVPNQNSFGHLHRWLVHEPYRRLAECPEGVRHPWSRRPEPFSLCPLDPGSTRLLADLYDQLFPCFSSSSFNAGLDETLDLGLGRSAEACRERGKGRVYLEFVRQVHALVAERGRRMQLWGDIVLAHPELLEELPDDVVLLGWGYEASHPFDRDAALLAASGRHYYVCPGTSSWMSFAGRADNALRNLAAAARAGQEHAAKGYLVCDWGDFGHLQPMPVSYLGLLAGAGFAWNSSTAHDADELDIAGLLDRHAFRDAAGRAGAASVRLAEIYRRPAATPANGSALFDLLIFPERPLDHPRYRGLERVGLAAARDEVEAALALLGDSRLQTTDADLIPRELRWAGDALALACDLGLARLDHGGDRPIDGMPHGVRERLGHRLRELREALPTLWLARHRPGGLDDSLAHFVPLAERLAARTPEEA